MRAIDLTINPLDEHGGRAERIRRQRKVSCRVNHVMQEFLIGVSDREARFWINGTNVDFEPGEILLLNPGDTVAYSTLSIPDSGTTYHGVNISPQAMSKISAGLGHSQNEMVNFLSSRLSHPSLSKLLLSLNQDLLSATDAEESDELLRNVLGVLMEAKAAEASRFSVLRARRWKIRRALRFIHENHHKKIQIEDIAAVAQLSISQFSRVFADETGVSPHAYILHYRVNRARTLLAYGVPIATVANQTGFVDQAHLTRHFKRLVAITPGNYRRSSRILQDARLANLSR